MGEQANGRDGVNATGDAAAVGTDGPGPTVDRATSPTVRSPDARGRPSAASRIRFAIRTGINLLAIVVEVVAIVFMAVLLARIGLAFVAVNPQNAIVRAIDGFADAVVLAFRDLFLPADPRVRLAVNYGVAAAFWLVVGLIANRALRGLARLVAGRTTSP